MKYKICPRCGKHNSPTAFDCEECGTDLTSVRITDEQTEQAAQTPAPRAKTVRICEACGFSNPANARKCLSCGEDVSDVVPVEEGAAQPKREEAVLRFTLLSLDGQYAFALSPGKTLLGREAQMSEYLANRDFVSRRHAELDLTGDRLTVLNVSRTNYTYVNNKKTVSEIVELHNGDELGLGGNCINGQRQDRAAYLIVRIGPCT